MLDFTLHLSVGTFFCAAAVGGAHFTGLYLFRAGCNDFQKGCEEMKDEFNRVNQQLQFLKIFLPVCALLRVFCVPSVWYYMAETDNFGGALHSVPALMWVILWAIPFVLFKQILLMPGISQVLSSDRTIAEWPTECAVQRPYHGLLSTRCHAASGGFYIELLWNAWIIFQGTSIEGRVGGITIALVIFNAGMLMGGPVNFLSRGPTVDKWVAETYLVVSLFAVEGYVLLNHAWFGIRMAVSHETNLSPYGPYGHWSVLVWNGLLILQTLVCRTAVLNAQELKGGPPWNCGQCDHKEFFFPRFWGLIYVCYGMMISFNFWIVGIWLWVPAQAEPYPVVYN